MMPIEKFKEELDGQITVEDKLNLLKTQFQIDPF